MTLYAIAYPGEPVSFIDLITPPAEMGQGAPGDFAYMRLATVQEIAAVTTPTPQAVFAAAVAAGIQIASTGTPALNGTYAIDTPSKATIDGIYAGIKDGDGLPGGAATFNYPDTSGAMHAFSATTFPVFAKAVRDYLYALSQGQAPALPVTIA